VEHPKRELFTRVEDLRDVSAELKKRSPNH